MLWSRVRGSRADDCGSPVKCTIRLEFEGHSYEARLTEPMHEPGTPRHREWNVDVYGQDWRGRLDHWVGSYGWDSLTDQLVINPSRCAPRPRMETVLAPMLAAAIRVDSATGRRVQPGMDHRTLTVSELIERLQALPGSAPVYFAGSEWFQPVTGAGIMKDSHRKFIPTETAPVLVVLLDENES